MEEDRRTTTLLQGSAKHHLEKDKWRSTEYHDNTTPRGSNTMGSLGEYEVQDKEEKGTNVKYDNPEPGRVRSTTPGRRMRT